MWRTPLPSSASYNGMMAPPGYPNTRSTPSARRQLNRISEPLGIDDFCFLFFRRGLGLLAFLGEPRHHGAQLGAHFLDLVLALFLAKRREVLAAVLVFGNPLAREGAVLNASEDFLHCFARFVANNFFTACEVTVLRGIGDRVTHAGEPAFVDEVHDELHLVQALEVGNLRLVTGFDERLETFLDQRSQAATQPRLL